MTSIRSIGPVANDSRPHTPLPTREPGPGNGWDLRRFSFRLREMWQLDQPMCFESSLATLDENYGLVDPDGDGSFTVENLLALAEDPGTPPELKRAVRSMLASPSYLNMLDYADGEKAFAMFGFAGISLPGMSLMGVPREPFTREGLTTALENERQAPDGLPSVEELGRDVNARFTDLDRDGNGQVTRAELEQAGEDPTARALLANPNLLNALDGGYRGYLDGGITAQEALDVDSAPTQPSDNHWGPADQACLDDVLAEPTEFPDLIGTFDQGGRGNCVSVGSIKAAMDTFGSEVFQQVDQLPGGGYRVTMRDGVTVELSREDLKVAAQASDFEGPDSGALAYATLCFAAMGKRAQAENPGAFPTLMDAFYSLDTGANAMAGFNLLGLNSHVQTITADQIPDSQGVLGLGVGHVAFVESSTGMVDNWGRPVALGGDGWQPYAFLALTQESRDPALTPGSPGLWIPNLS